MSSRYVRRKVGEWMALMTVPYYPTVNVEQDPTDATWVTVEYNIPFNNTLTFCNNKLEEGSFTIAFFGQSGIGDDQLLTAAEADVDLFMSQVDSAGLLQLMRNSPPIDFRQHEFYVVEFTIDYEYQESTLVPLYDMAGERLYDLAGEPLFALG